MTNLDKANKEALLLLENNNINFFNATVKPLVSKWLPQLAHITSHKNNNGESFLYYVEWNKHFFMEIYIDENIMSSGTCPWFELLSYDYKLENDNDKFLKNMIDKMLKQYPLYLTPNESLKLFISNDLPKLKNYNRNKEIDVLCYTDKWQWNIGHLYLDSEFIKILADSWLSINYIVMIE